MIKTIFFDLDGTLTDSCPGIFTGVSHALAAFGIRVAPVAVTREVIGPPLFDCFHRIYGLPEEDARRAVAIYREYYGREGLFVNDVYDGVFSMLSALKEAGYTMMMATGKPHEYARRIAAHFGLDAYLTAVYGAEFDGTRGDKADLLRYAMEKEGLSPDDCVMVGDRRYDIKGALEVGATPIGVLWGYGDRAELCGAGCEHFAEKPADLVEIIARITK